jgi:predicted MFS family arabinose efflux permease
MSGSMTADPRRETARRMISPTGDGSSLARNREFLLLATGQTISRLGDGIFVTALAWTAWQAQRSATAVAAVTFAFMGATFVATLIGSSYADRVDRRRLMIACDLARLLLVAAVVAAALVDALTFAVLAVAAALVGIAGGPFAPARNALVPALVSPASLVAANGVLQASFRSAFFVGPLLLGPMIGAVGAAGAFGFDALTFVVSAASLAALHPRPRESEHTRRHLREDLGGGYRELRQTPELLIVIAVFVTAIFFASGFLTVGTAQLAAERLGGGAGTYGLLLGVAGLAEILAAVAFTRVQPRRLARASLFGWVVLGVFRLPLGWTSSLEEALPLMTLTGCASAVTDVPLITLAQKRISDGDLAKVLGFWEAGIVGASAVSAPLAGAVIAGTSLQVGFALSGALIAGTALAGVYLLEITRW